MIYFRELNNGSDTKELQFQHKEWFPLDYPKDWYKKSLMKNNIIKIGCFVRIPQQNKLNNQVFEYEEEKGQGDSEDKDEDEQQEEEDNQQGNMKEVMLGSIISRIKTDKEDVNEILDHEKRLEQSKEGWMRYLLSSISCKNLFTSNKES